MSYTLEDAFERMAVDFLNDPNRTDFTDAKMRRAVVPSLSQCLEEYAQAGGRRLQRRGTGTIASGVLALAAVDISSVQSVAQVNGSSEWSMRATHTNAFSTGGATLDVAYYYSPQLAPPSVANKSQPLIGDGATEEPGAWDALAEWICVRSAKMLRVQRGEAPPPGLVLLESEARSVVLDSKGTPSARTLRPIGSNMSNYFWSWRPSSRELLVTLG